MGSVTKLQPKVMKEAMTWAGTSSFSVRATDYPEYCHAGSIKYPGR
jgi:hypothetical protein